MFPKLKSPDGLTLACYKPLRFKLFFAIIFIGLCSVKPVKAQYSLADFPYEIIHLDSSKAIMDSSHFIALGAGYDGKRFSMPSIIRVPDWIPMCNRPDPSAKYYMYFAHHYACRYIRMAWSANIEGPYHLYDVSPSQPAGTRGVLDMGYGTVLPIGNGLSLSHHIGSPDVQIDHDKKLIYLYFTSGPQVSSSTRDRYLNYRTYVATSSDGLCFYDTSVNDPACGIVPARIATNYSRVFQVKERIYSIVNMGQIWGATSSFNPLTHDYNNEVWQMFNNPLQDYYGWSITPGLVNEPYASRGYTDVGCRHPMVSLISTHYSQIFYSRYNDANGENICRALMHMPTEDPSSWQIVDVDEEFMNPTLAWEGANHPIVATTYGGGLTDRELRDPYFFKDSDGKTYLLYVGGGEVGIGIVELRLTQDN